MQFFVWKDKDTLNLHNTGGFRFREKKNKESGLLLGPESKITTVSLT